MYYSVDILYLIPYLSSTFTTSLIGYTLRDLSSCVHVYIVSGLNMHWFNRANFFLQR